MSVSESLSLAGMAWPEAPPCIEPPRGAPQALAAQALWAFCAGDLAADGLATTVPLKPLAADCGEWWPGRGQVRGGAESDLSWREDGERLFLHLALDEAALQPMAAAVEGAYRRVLAAAAARGYPHLWRIWHYLGDITEGEGDQERYRQFCIGRHRALAAAPGYEAQLPAASAIGIRGGGLRMTVLAGRRAGLQVENPRQVSAFRYPRAYGPRSPSFSRAMLLPWRDAAQLLVSGTASIVGHATAHAGDALAQLRQTAANLAALRTQAARALNRPADHDPWSVESMTLYLRHEASWPEVAAELRRLFPAQRVQVYLGDICRRELLLEIEAVYRAALAS
jgi:chorismate lyase/3-hydroxybenzoate synthase